MDCVSVLYYAFRCDTCGVVDYKNVIYIPSVED